MHIIIQPAAESDKSLIDDLMQGYIEELSHYTPIARSENGRFVYPYLEAYWQEPEDRFPFLIIADQEIVGFVLVNRHSRLSDDDAMSIAEFHVVPAVRRHGVGLEAAHQAFLRFPGRWEVAVLKGNVSARAFWLRAIETVASSEITEHTSRPKGPIFTFTVASTSGRP